MDQSSLGILGHNQLSTHKLVLVAHLSKHMKFKCRIANQRKISKWLPFKKLQVRITKYLMCIYEGHKCITVPNRKFVCLTLWLGELCTDANIYADDAGH